MLAMKRFAVSTAFWHHGRFPAPYALIGHPFLLLYISEFLEDYLVFCPSPDPGDN
jgi:hypothetical protein